MFDIAKLCHQISPNVDTTKPNILPCSPFNLQSSELYFWGVTFPPQSSEIISKTMTPWPFHQNHMFDMAKLCHHMSPDVDTTKPNTLPGSPFNLLSSEFYLWGWLSRLNPVKLSQRQWPLDLYIKITCWTWKNYVTRCHQMLIRQNQIYCQVAHSIFYHLSFIYGGDPPALIL